MGLLETLRDFAKNTSIHGFGYVVTTKLSMRTRLSWALITFVFMLLASLWLRASVICKSFQLYLCKRSWPFYNMVLHKSALYIPRQEKLARCLIGKLDPASESSAKIRSCLQQLTITNHFIKEPCKGPFIYYVGTFWIF